MPTLQSWDIVVAGQPHRVELDRNPDTGKHLLRVDGRIALKPFSETRAELPLEVAGKPFLLHVEDGIYRLEDKGSRYHDSSAPREGANLGQLTICRSLEAIVVITDDAILRIPKLAEGFKQALTAGSGGGLVGALVAGAGLAVAERLSNTLGEVTFDRPIRSFNDLPSEGFCRLEHLPLDLVALFSEELDLECRVMVVPRKVVRAIESGGRKILVHTSKSQASGAKPYKLDTLHETQKAIDHLCGAGYPMPDEQVTQASEFARDQRARRTASAASPPAPAAVGPAGPSTQVAKNFAGLPEVRWTAPLVTTIGREAGVITQMDEDARAYASVYPKTATRRVQVEAPLRNLGKEHHDIVHLAGTFDEKTRFKEAAGFSISLKDLVMRLMDARVKMLWLASANDPGAAEATLQWAEGLSFLLVFTIERDAAYSSTIAVALRRLAAGEPLSVVLPELERTSNNRWRMAGRGEAIFRAQ